MVRISVLPATYDDCICLAAVVKCLILSYIKLWHPLVAMAPVLRNSSGLGTLFRKASSLACDSMCVCDLIVYYSGQAVGPCFVLSS